MYIISHGQSCFQISTSKDKNHQTSIVIDPFDNKTGLRIPSLEADILAITHHHHDHNNTATVKGSAFLVDGPGEYEIKGVFVQGFSAFHDNKEGKERGQITIYTFEIEDMKLCHLGDLGQSELTSEQLEEIGVVDILMIPVGGVYTINGEQAVKIINQIQPRIVIPMHYHLPKLKIKLDNLNKFLKAIGQKAIEPQKKLTIKKKDLPLEKTEIVILQP